ncbi:DUF397 domain-containing protein [Streptomyces sp. NPDC007100]
MRGGGRPRRAPRRARGALRDSRHPEKGDLRFTPEEWVGFREGVRNGESD